MSVTIKFTRKQVQTFLKHWGNSIEDWYAEKPKGEELMDLKIVARFFQKLQDSIKRGSKPK